MAVDQQVVPPKANTQTANTGTAEKVPASTVSTGTSPVATPQGARQVEPEQAPSVSGQETLPPAQPTNEAAEIGRGRLVFKDLGGRSCSVTVADVASMFRLKSPYMKGTIVESSGKYQIKVGAKTFFLAADGKLFGPLPDRDVKYQAGDRENDPPNENNELARLALVNGKLLFVPPGMRRIEGTIERIPADGLAEVMATALRWISSIVYNAKARVPNEPVAECKIQLFKRTLELPSSSQHQERSDSAWGATISYESSEAVVRLMSNGQLVWKKDGQWIFHALVPGEPTEGFTWNKIQHKVRML
jgi:hypothetical protein